MQLALIDGHFGKRVYFARKSFSGPAGIIVIQVYPVTRIALNLAIFAGILLNFTCFAAFSERFSAAIGHLCCPRSAKTRIENALSGGDCLRLQVLLNSEHALLAYADESCARIIELRDQ